MVSETTCYFRLAGKWAIDFGMALRTRHANEEQGTVARHFVDFLLLVATSTAWAFASAQVVQKPFPISISAVELLR